MIPTELPERSPQSASVGDQIGPYRVMELIGEGGFGLVFVAEQQQPVRRTVALKVLKPGMDTRQVVARFEAEPFLSWLQSGWLGCLGLGLWVRLRLEKVIELAHHHMRHVRVHPYFFKSEGTSPHHLGGLLEPSPCRQRP